MRSKLWAVAVLVATLGLGPMPAQAQGTPIDTLGAACNANPRFFDFAVTGLESDAQSLTRLCSCLVTEFAPLPDTDLAILTKDLEGSTTEADKTAYGDYAGLQLKARTALDKCLVIEGFADGADPATQPGGPPDMTKFASSCTASPIVLLLVGDVAGAEERRATVCSCLIGALAPHISTADADILATDLDGTSTDATHAAYSGYPSAEKRAGVAINGCLAQIEGSPPPEAQ